MADKDSKYSQAELDHAYWKNVRASMKGAGISISDEQLFRYVKEHKDSKRFEVVKKVCDQARAEGECAVTALREAMDKGEIPR